jgi:hypothetical protein
MTSRDVTPPAFERRLRPRAPVLSEHMMEFKLPGSPIYQLKLKDITEAGAGVIVKPQSKFLSMIQVGQELSIRLITPRGSPYRPGSYRGRITQITELTEGTYRGHMLVGLSLITEGKGPPTAVPVILPPPATLPS